MYIYWRIKDKRGHEKTFMKKIDEVKGEYTNKDWCFDEIRNEGAKNAQNDTEKYE